jgi:hypothetical protein
MYDENGMFIGEGPFNAGLNYKSPYGSNVSLGQMANMNNPNLQGFNGSLQSGFTGSFKSQGAFSPSEPMAPSGPSFASTLPPAWQGDNTAAAPAQTAAGSALKAAGGMLGAGSFALGGLQTIGGLIGLATTKEPDKYSLTANTQQAIGESKSAAKFGLSPTQLAAYNTNVRQSANTDIYNARNMAGNSLSRAVFGVRRGQTLGALNNLAASDFEAMQRKVQYRNQMYGIEQGMKDRNTQLDWNQYGQKMQAYGGAMRSGLNNMAGFFNLGQALKYSSLIT